MFTAMPTMKVIRIDTICDSAYNIASLGAKAVTQYRISSKTHYIIMSKYSTQSHYPDIEQTSSYYILVMLTAFVSLLFCIAGPFTVI